MNRKILVYGGSGGIGSATARLLHDQGCELHLVGRDRQRLETISAETGAGFTAGDVSDSGLFERVMQQAGDRLDGLVYAVGTINLRRLQRLTEADFIDDFRINAMCAALAIQAALPALKKSSQVASVVLFSSVAAKQGFSFHASIGMAKAAVSGLTLSLGAELAPKVRVNAIAPSLVRTPLAAGILTSDETEAAITQLHAMQTLGTADDIAALAAFLLSSQADWITGQVISVDGGRSTLRNRG